MTVAINGTALIRHAATQVDYRIEAEELDWDQVGGDEEQMGPRLQFAAEIDHPDLGLLSWEAWEYRSLRVLLDGALHVFWNRYGRSGEDEATVGLEVTGNVNSPIAKWWSKSAVGLTPCWNVTPPS